MTTMLPAAYSIPKANKLGVVDSSMAVKDRKEKKRIQNRVAQRVYRQRVKARLAELQARVEDHEQSRLQRTDDDDTLGASQSRTVTAEQCAISPKSPPNLDRSAALGLVPQGGSFQKQRLPLQVHCPQNVQETGETRIGNAKLLLDYNGPAQHPLDQTIWQDNASFLGNVSGGPNASPVLAEQSNSATVFMTESRRSIDRLLDTLGNTWEPEPPYQPMSRIPSVGSVSNPTRTSDSPHNTPNSVAMSTDHTSLNDRLECVMECVMHNGFDNFDVLVTAYYNGTFAESSPLSYEQRLSRTRRLPKVIADICYAADQWDPWERRMFHEEILKTTETILLSEGDGARNNLNDCIIPLAQAQHTTSKTGSPNAIKQIIQNELPTRWALMMGLAAANRAAWQRDRSDTALAAIVLLHFAGRIPKEQLLCLLSTFL
ncbi:hypothetical protein N7467_008627 [Penicillium canescens]|nr:hypothetical protein N7467_008627 [Penicillium canescens]